MVCTHQDELLCLVFSVMSAAYVENVLVTCRVVRKIKEFGSYGNLLREHHQCDDNTP